MFQQLGTISVPRKKNWGSSNPEFVGASYMRAHAAAKFCAMIKNKILTGCTTPPAQPWPHFFNPRDALHSAVLLSSRVCPSHAGIVSKG